MVSWFGIIEGEADILHLKRAWIFSASHVVLAFAVLCIPHGLFGDTIVLTNGESGEATLVERHGAFLYVFWVDRPPVAYSMSDIDWDASEVSAAKMPKVLSTATDDRDKGPTPGTGESDSEKKYHVAIPKNTVITIVGEPPTEEERRSARENIPAPRWPSDAELRLMVERELREDQKRRTESRSKDLSNEPYVPPGSYRWPDGTLLPNRNPGNSEFSAFDLVEGIDPTLLPNGYILSGRKLDQNGPYGVINDPFQRLILQRVLRGEGWPDGMIVPPPSSNGEQLTAFEIIERIDPRLLPNGYILNTHPRPIP